MRGSTLSRGPRTNTLPHSGGGPSIHPPPTHRPPFHSGLFGAALAAWLSPLSHLLLLLLLLALGLREEALLFFKSLRSFTPLLDPTQMPVKRKAGS